MPELRSPVSSPELLAALEKAQDRWPRVTLSLEALVAHLSGLNSAESVPPHGAEVALACACIKGDAAAQQVLETDYLPQVLPSLRKLSASEAFVDEALQELRTKLLTGNPARLATYSGRGPLGAWLRVAATRVGLDALRREGRKKETPDEDVGVLAGADPGPELALFRAKYGTAFRSALRSAVAELTAQERNVLRLHFVEGLNIEAIGQAFGVHRATVARWIVKARSQILTLVRTQLTSKATGLSGSEFDSLAKLVHSEVALGVTGILSSGVHSEQAAEKSG